MSANGLSSGLRDRRLEAFLDSHDLHLLSDSTEAVSVGSIYRKDPGEDKLRRIGDVSNFVIPSITLPEPKKGLQSPINENFRNNRSLNFMAKLIAKFVWSLAFSADSSKQELLEVNYDKVEFEEVEPVVFASQLRGHRLDISNWLYKPDSHYYIVTKVVKSPNFRVNVKVSSDLRTILAGSREQSVVQGQFQMEFARGKLDEAMLTYLGERPLVFAVHLEELEFVRDNGNLVNMRPLSEVVRVLAPSDRILETEASPSEVVGTNIAGDDNIINESILDRKPGVYWKRPLRPENIDPRWMNSLHSRPEKPNTGPRVNVWIDSHHSKEPLQLKERYTLKVNVGALKSDVIVSADAQPLESLIRKYQEVMVDVSLIGDAFEIDPQVQQLSLSPKGDSDPISFSIRPIQEGSQNLSMLFYYKVNLLLVMSIPLHILKEPATYPTTGGEFMNTQIVASSGRGFASIFEIDQVT